MKTNFFCLLVFLVISASSVSAQTRQSQVALQQLEKEIQFLQLEIEKIDTLRISWRIKQLQERAQGYLSTAEAAALRREIDIYQTKLRSDKEILLSATQLLVELKAQKKELKNMAIEAAMTEKTPKELRSLEKKRRINAQEVRSGDLQLQKSELALQKLSETPVDARGPQGLKVLIWNQDRYKSANFKIQSVDETDGISAFLAPGEKLEVYLLPGQYTCTVQISGRKEGQSKMIVGIRQSFIAGISYHGYCIQPAR